MAENSTIEWTTHTFNPWIGCTKLKVHDTPSACDFCYAEAMAKRFKQAEWGNHPRVRTSEAYWRGPLHWAKRARTQRDDWRYRAPKSALKPERPRVFCASMADVFDNQVPQEWREDLWKLIEATPELDWLLLTKRPQNIRKMIPERWATALPQHIWLGITAENQTEYDRRWPYVESIVAFRRFVSYEPALGPLDLSTVSRYRHPHMIICGGEDRQRATRPTNDEFLPWARSLRDQCERMGVAFFFKQIVGKGEIPPDLQIRQLPTVHRRTP
jgi:protein gp37